MLISNWRIVPHVATMNLRQYLEANEAAYQSFTHSAASTAQELTAAEHAHGREHAKAVILRAGSEFIMVVLPAMYHVDFERARAATGRRDLELATEDQIIRLFPD